MTALDDPHAFARAYREHRAGALAAAQRVLHDHGAAEDVVQEVFVQLWRRPRSFDERRGSLRSYITMLARSRAIDRWRSQSVQDSAVERLRLEPNGDEEASAADCAIARERAAWAARIVDRLPGPQREAILLAYGADMTAGEIASVLGVPHGTAKSRVRLGLEKLRVA
jgi:RNA polymerase sigma-70 factor (ECF subfamily)